MEEIFKTIPDFEKYQVSNTGKIKTLKGLKEAGIIMQPSINAQGYRVISLRKNKESFKFPIHSIVALVFLNFIKAGSALVIDHLDRNRLNDNNIEFT